MANADDMASAKPIYLRGKLVSGLGDNERLASRSFRSTRRIPVNSSDVLVLEHDEVRVLERAPRRLNAPCSQAKRGGFPLRDEEETVGRRRCLGLQCVVLKESVRGCSRVRARYLML